MDGFHYYNLFETKGIEYLLTIAFFVLLIPYWRLLNRKLQVVEPVKTGYSIIGDLFRIPADVYFAINHTWVKLMQSGRMRLGLDDILVSMTGKIDVQMAKKSGDFVSKGELLAEIVKNNHKLKVFSPVSGIVSKMNTAIMSTPALIASEPYSEGWLCEMQANDWQNESKTLLTSQMATHWFTQELSRLKEFFALMANSGSLKGQPIILQDGGELRKEVLAEMPELVWKDFQNAFLNMPAEN